MGKPSTKVRINKVRKSMPFQPDGGPHDSEARSMKAKQRQWMMDGLRAMKAPVALNLKFIHNFCFEPSSYLYPKQYLMDSSNLSHLEIVICYRGQTLKTSGNHFATLRCLLPWWLSYSKWTAWTGRNHQTTLNALPVIWR